MIALDIRAQRRWEERRERRGVCALGCIAMGASLDFLPNAVAAPVALVMLPLAVWVLVTAIHEGVTQGW